MNSNFVHILILVDTSVVEILMDHHERKINRMKISMNDMRLMEWIFQNRVCYETKSV